MIVTLTLGDWSGDGHWITDKVAVETDMTPAEIEAAYAAGTEVVGFDFKETVATGYDDRQLSSEQAERLQALGFGKLADAQAEAEQRAHTGGQSPAVVWNDYAGKNDDGWDLTMDAYADIYLFVVTLGAPDATFAPLTLGNVNIGGYGLFAP